MNFIKLIYFDESFVADFIQIIAGGELKKTTEFITNVNLGGEASGDMEASIGADKNGFSKLVEFISGASLGLSAKAGVNTAYTRDKVVKNILENTLLADFMDILKSDERKSDKNKKCKGIHIFDKLEVRPEPNSFTFFMLAAPFFSMIDGDFPISADDGREIKLNIQQIGQAINDGRGYYEFIAHTGGEDIVLRFNISAFRNNYTMSDLPKMQLTYYAIYVGETSRDKLQIQKEFEFGTKTTTRINYGSSLQPTLNEIKLKVYDVILSGVGE